MYESRDGRRVVITGVGVLGPCGTGAEDFWKGLGEPVEPAVNRKVEGFDPQDYGLKYAEARRLDRFAQFAVAAASMALEDAGTLDYDEWRKGVILGTGIGGAYAWESNAIVLTTKGEKGVSPLTVPMVMPNAGSAAVSMRFGFRGPVETVTTACAAGTHAISNGARLVASGRCDVVLAGGSESCQTGVMTGGFTNMKALSPTGVSRPFDAERNGFCSAEAAGVLVLETLAAAQARGAKIYAEVAGSGSTADAHHITAPDPQGAGAVASMRAALADAGVSPGDITQVNAHGTSTPLNEKLETAALRRVFGDWLPRVPVSSTKSMTGHLLGAAGAIEAVISLMAMRDSVIPPTINYEAPDPDCDLDVVPNAARPGSLRHVMSNSLGFGGHNVSLIFSQYEETPAG